MAVPSQDHDSIEAEAILSFQQSLSKFTYSSRVTQNGKQLVPQVQPSKPNRPSNFSGSLQPAKRKRVPSEEDGLPTDTSREVSPKKSKVKRTIKRRGPADPEKYSHLRHINDCLEENLDVVFCGINPGQLSAETGHHFAHPSNHFWKCLHLSGLTPERIPPTEDYTMPERFSLGIANELKDSEMKDGIPTFLQKIGRYHPRIVAFVGLHTARLVHNYVLKHESTLGSNAENGMPRIVRWDHDSKVFKPGLQCYKMIHKVSDHCSGSTCQDEEHIFARLECAGVYHIPETLFYALPCTSGRVRGYQISDKVTFFSEIKRKLEDIKSATTISSVRAM